MSTNPHLTTETLTEILQAQYDNATEMISLCEQEGYSDYHVPGWQARRLEVVEISRRLMITLQQEDDE